MSRPSWQPACRTLLTRYDAGDIIAHHRLAGLSHATLNARSARTSVIVTAGHPRAAGQWPLGVPQAVAPVSPNAPSRRSSCSGVRLVASSSAWVPRKASATSRIRGSAVSAKSAEVPRVTLAFSVRKYSAACFCSFPARRRAGGRRRERVRSDRHDGVCGAPRCSTSSCYDASWSSLAGTSARLDPLAGWREGEAAEEWVRSLRRMGED